MKTLILHGVPYNVNDTNQVFLYSKSNVSASAPATSPTSVAPIQVGTYDPASGFVQLFPDWEAKSAAFLTHYRETLRQSTEEALEKARILQTS